MRAEISIPLSKATGFSQKPVFGLTFFPMLEKTNLSTRRLLRTVTQILQMSRLVCLGIDKFR